MPKYMMNDGSWHNNVKRLCSCNPDAGNDTGDWWDWQDIYPPDTPAHDANQDTKNRLALKVGLAELHDPLEEFLNRLEWEADRLCSMFDTPYNTTSLESY